MLKSPAIIVHQSKFMWTTNAIIWSTPLRWVVPINCEMYQIQKGFLVLVYMYAGHVCPPKWPLHINRLDYALYRWSYILGTLFSRKLAAQEIVLLYSTPIFYKIKTSHYGWRILMKAHPKIKQQALVVLQNFILKCVLNIPTSLFFSERVSHTAVKFVSWLNRIRYAKLQWN